MIVATEKVSLEDVMNEFFQEVPNKAFVIW